MRIPLQPQTLQRLLEQRFSAGTSASGTNEPPPQVHLVGAGGAGMTALSEILMDFGWTLSGSDLNVVGNDVAASMPPVKPGRILKIHQGHDSANLPATADLVIFSPAISADNPELTAARQLNIPAVSYVDFLSELLNQSTGICIAGTHGKTTTSAMTAAILREAGLASSAVIGGEVIQYGRSGWGPIANSNANDSDSLLVVEACEYRRHFLSFRPQIATILNIEADHFDCFETIDQTYDAFVEFAARIRPDGTLIIRADCPLMTRLRNDCPGRIETFLPVSNASGLGRNAAAQADWAVSSLREESERTVFDIVHKGRTFGTIELTQPGRHNVENALAAIAVAHAAGVSADGACTAASSFQGVRRRFEEIATINGVTLVDDYAHHPTAVRATLAAARKKYSGRRLVAAFQPHQVSRTQQLMGEFARSFVDADEVLLVPIFAARENTDVADSAFEKLAAGINLAGSSVEVLPSLDQLRATLEDSAQPGDVWLTLGAGNINRIAHEFARTVQRNYTGR